MKWTWYWRCSRINGVVDRGILLITDYTVPPPPPRGGCKAGFHCMPECLLLCGEFIPRWRRAVLDIKNTVYQRTDQYKAFFIALLKSSE